jgi:hypothetical protein
METSTCVQKLKQLNLMDKLKQDALIEEFAANEYLKNCEFESDVDNLIFYLLNYALSYHELINDSLVKLLKDLFSHSDHCFFATDHNEHNCKISSKLYHSNWLKVYFETVSKVYGYNFLSMNDNLIEFMFILFKKSSNKQAINIDLVTTINHLIQNTTKELARKCQKKQTVSDEKKRKLILLIILILDGQFQTFIDRTALNHAVNFLDISGIRMYWENLAEFKDIRKRVENMLKFCRTLVESHNNMNDN